jgi:hypothetical protein
MFRSVILLPLREPNGACAQILTRSVVGGWLLAHPTLACRLDAADVPRMPRRSALGRAHRRTARIRTGPADWVGPDACLPHARHRRHTGVYAARQVAERVRTNPDGQRRSGDPDGIPNTRKPTRRERVGLVVGELDPPSLVGRESRQHVSLGCSSPNQKAVRYSLADSPEPRACRSARPAGTPRNERPPNLKCTPITEGILRRVDQEGRGVGPRHEWPRIPFAAFGRFGTALSSSARRLTFDHPAGRIRPEGWPIGPRRLSGRRLDAAPPEAPLLSGSLPPIRPGLRPRSAGQTAPDSVKLPGTGKPTSAKRPTPR